MENANERLVELFSKDRPFAEAFGCLFEDASDAIYILDKHGNFVSVNRKAEELTGFKREDYIGKSFRKIIPLKSLSKAIRGFLDVIRGKEVRLELELKTAAKKTVLVEVTSRPLIVKGKIVGTLGIVRDITERVLMENKLKEANRKLEMLFETAMEGIAVVDTEENLTFVNKAFADILGYKEDELIGINIRKLVDEKGFKEIGRQTEIRKKGKVSRYELIMYGKDGRPRIFQVSASPLWNEYGGFAGTLGIVMDFTERKKAEKALLESQQKFERLFKSNPEATVYVDSNDRVLDVNPRFSELFGYSLDEVKGKCLDDLIVPRDKEKEAEMLTKKNKEGYVYYETVRKRKDGSLIPVSISAASLISEDQHLGDIVLYKDITERKRMEEVIRKSEEKFRSIFESANDCLIYLDRFGKIIDVNERGVQVFGGSRKELLGRHFTRVGVFSPKDIPKLLSAFANILVGKTATLEMRIRNKKGQEIDLECSSSLTTIGDTLVGILIIARDITERKQMQKKLEEYSEQLEEMVEKRTKQLKEAQEQIIKSERLAAIGQVAAMVGHDLRNPLTGINSAAYYLKTKLGPKMDRKIKEMVELIEKNIQYSNKIITDLLEYSREIRLELTKTTPKLIIVEALSLVEVPDNIQVLDSTQEEPKIKIDIEKMKRVFQNIIKNAIDAMPHGGRLTITSKESNGELKIAFTDTGTGMTKEAMEKIWTPFFTTKARGMGLGLPICKRIIEAHRGKISVESTVDKGTTFTVTLPIEPKILEGGEKIWVKPPESLLSTTTKA